MGKITDKTPHASSIAVPDENATVGRNGRSIPAEREMINNLGFDDISNLTANQIPLPTSDVEMEVVSNSSEDGPGGSGALSVLIVTLDADFREDFNRITLGDIAPIQLTSKSGSGIRRINSFLVQSVGTERGAAVGTIVVRDKNTPSIIYAQIDPTENASSQSLRTVPFNTSAIFTGWYCAAWTIAKTVKFRFQTTFNEPNDEITPGVFTTRDRMEMVSSQLYKPFIVPFVLPAGTDMIINATVVQGGNADAMASYQYFIQR